jgi:hypothetical protein
MKIGTGYNKGEMKKMAKSGKVNYNNKMKGNGYATEIIIKDQRGKVVFRFAPCNENNDIALRTACDFVENKLGISLFNKGMVLMNHDFNPTNIPKKTTIDKADKIKSMLTSVLSQIKGMA